MKQLEAAFKKLKISTSTGPDGIPSYLIEIDPIAKQVFVNIELNDETVIVCASYFAPNSDYSSYRNHFDKILFHTHTLKSEKIIV